MSLQQTFDEIDRFYTDRMSEEEKTDFKTKLEHDVNLQKDVQLYHDINSSINSRKSLEFAQFAIKDLRESRKTNYVLIKKLKPLYKFAALLVLFLGISIIIVFLTRKQPKRTVASFYKPLKIEHQFRGSDNLSDKNLKIGINLFNNGKYEESADVFKNLLSQNSQHNQAKYYLGLSHLFDGNNVLAIQYLEEIAYSGELNYSAGAYYYLSWGFLQMGDTLKAKSSLDSIQNSTYYKEKVNQLIKLLDN